MKFFKQILFLIPLFFLGCLESAKDPRDSVYGDVQREAGANATFFIEEESFRGQSSSDQANDQSFGLPTQQKLNLTICLRSKALRERLPNMPFGISDGTSEIAVWTNSDGCLSWHESHNFVFFADETWIALKRTIVGRGNQRGAQPLSLVADPWPIREGKESASIKLSVSNFDFPRLLNPQHLSFQDPYPLVDFSARYGLSHFILESHGFGAEKEYQIDRHLNLSVPYRYRMTLSPFIERKLLDQSFTKEFLKSGKLQAHITVFSAGGNGPTQDSRYLTSTASELSFDSEGKAKEDIILKFPHPLLASGRKTFLVSVSSLPGLTTILGRNFSGNVEYIGGRYETDLNLDTRLRTAEQESSMGLAAVQMDEKADEQAPTSVQKFIKAQEAIYTEVEAFPELRQAPPKDTMDYLFNLSERTGKFIYQEELKHALTHGISNELLKNQRFSFRQRLCMAYFSTDYVYNGKPRSSFVFDRNVYLEIFNNNFYYMVSHLCGTPEEAEKNIKVERFDFVEKLNSPNPRDIHTIMYGKMEFGVQFTSEHATGTSLTWGTKTAVEVGLGLSAKILGAIGGVGEAFQATTHYDTTGLTDKLRLDSGQDMAVNEWTMHLDAETRSCILLKNRAKKTIFEIEPPQPFLICENQTRRKDVAESFFLFDQIFGGSPYSGDFNNEQMGIKLLVRDQKHLADITDRLKQTDDQNARFDRLVHSHLPSLSLFRGTHFESLTDAAVPDAIQVE